MTQAQEFFDERIAGSTTSTQDPAYEAWFRRNVEAGLQDIREGRVVSDEEAHSEVEALYRELVAKS